MNTSLARQITGPFASKISGQFAPVLGGQFTRFLQLPFGIFKIEEKEKSRLWNIYNTPSEKEPQKPFDAWTEKGTASEEGSQLKLFW